MLFEITSQCAVTKCILRLFDHCKHPKSKYRWGQHLSHSESPCLNSSSIRGRRRATLSRFIRDGSVYLPPLQWTRSVGWCVVSRCSLSSASRSIYMSLWCDRHTLLVCYKFICPGAIDGLGRPLSLSLSVSGKSNRGGGQGTDRTREGTAHSHFSSTLISFPFSSIQAIGFFG